MTDSEWFAYWHQRLWQALADEDLESECLAIAALFCKPV
jgi:hypothetical protein